jgi:hypothetical protein
VTDLQEIAAALNLQLWTTELFLPQYRGGEIGPWRISPGGQLVHDWGYFSGPCLLEMMPSLARKALPKAGEKNDRWNTWMSLTPHEIESQEFGCRNAFGHTVVMGLGMGWIAANIALNPRVSKVTIVELDSDVMELFALSGALESIPREARLKIEIVNANALEWRPRKAAPVDFLNADIWLHLAEKETLQQVRQMQANVQASEIYYWGQEIAIYQAAMTLLPAGLPLTPGAVGRAISEVIKLPLLVPDDDYSAMIEKVIDNRIARGLNIKVNLTGKSE